MSVDEDIGAAVSDEAAFVFVDITVFAPCANDADGGGEGHPLLLLLLLALLRSTEGAKTGAGVGLGAEFISADGTDLAGTLCGAVWLLCCMITGDTNDGDSTAN